MSCESAFASIRQWLDEPPRLDPIDPPGAYIKFRRELALSESLVLRHWAKSGRCPKHAPTDYWREWVTRPIPTPTIDTQSVIEAHQVGLSVRKIAERYDVSSSYVQRRIKASRTVAA